MAVEDDAAPPDPGSGNKRTHEKQSPPPVLDPNSENPGQNDRRYVTLVRIEFPLTRNERRAADLAVKTKDLYASMLKADSALEILPISEWPQHVSFKTRLKNGSSPSISTSRKHASVTDSADFPLDGPDFQRHAEVTGDELHRNKQKKGVLRLMFNSDRTIGALKAASLDCLQLKTSGCSPNSSVRSANLLSAGWSSHTPS